MYARILYRILAWNYRLGSILGVPFPEKHQIAREYDCRLQVRGKIHELIACRSGKRVMADLCSELVCLKNLLNSWIHHSLQRVADDLWDKSITIITWQRCLGRNRNERHPRVYTGLQDSTSLVFQNNSLSGPSKTTHVWSANRAKTKHVWPSKTAHLWSAKETHCVTFWTNMSGLPRQRVFGLPIIIPAWPQL